MKTIRLRSIGDAMSTALDVGVHFSAPLGTVMDRLIQVAAILKSDAENAKGANDIPLAAACLVTRIETDFAQGNITVSACVPEGMTSEQVQRALLKLVPAE